MDKTNILDTVILNIEGNAWTTRDACTGTIVFGMTGSGKSSGPLYKIANQFLSLGYGGIVFCAKPDEAVTWEKYAKEAHRENDLLYLSRETFNYLDHEARRAGAGGGEIENIVNLYLEIVNMGKDKKHGGSSSDEYWQNAVKQLLRNCITLLKMGGEAVSIENIYKIIISAPSSDITGEIKMPDGDCMELLEISIPHELRNTPEYQLAKSYFCQEFATLDNRTRSNTISSFSVTADAMQRGELHRCFSASKSTLNLDDIYKKRKILLVDYDVKSWGRAGQYAAGIMKYCFEMMIERREDISNEDAIPVFLWADECQFFSLEYDQKFQTTARSSRTLTVYATQNIGNLQDGYGKEKAASLIGNLGTKFFCQNGEFETNEWAAKSIGQEIIKRKSVNIGDSKSSSIKIESDNQSKSYSEGYSEQKDYRVDPSVFTMLQTGGPRGQCKVGFIFWQSGRIMNNGSVFIRSTVEQQCRLVCGARKVRQCPHITNPEEGIYLGERKFFVASDILIMIGLLLSALMPLVGYGMLYWDRDIPIFRFNHIIYINFSTLLFCVLGAFFNLLIVFSMRIPQILHCILHGAKRVEPKTLPGLVWYDAVLFYLIGCVIMAMYLQYNLYDSWEKTGITLLIWFGATMLYRFLKSTGKREIKN